jgi:hypothetical protein
MALLVDLSYKYFKLLGHTLAARDDDACPSRRYVLNVAFDRWEFCVDSDLTPKEYPRPYRDPLLTKAGLHACLLEVVKIRFTANRGNGKLDSC